MIRHIRAKGKREVFYDQATTWAKTLPDSAWKSFHLLEETTQRHCAVRTTSGRILTGSFKAFTADRLALYHSDKFFTSKYGRCLDWVEIAD